MTRTEDRLADALGVAADAVRADTLRPLVAPSPRRARPAWLAPAAAAASIVVLAGLVATGTAVFGTGAGKRAAPPPVPAAARAAVPRYYVEADLDRRITVRSTATSRVTSTLPIRGPLPIGLGAVASAGHGLFFAAGVSRRAARSSGCAGAELNVAGQVTGLIPVPADGWRPASVVDGMAAAPGGAVWRSATRPCGTATRPGPTGSS